MQLEPVLKNKCYGFPQHPAHTLSNTSQIFRHIKLMFPM